MQCDAVPSTHPPQTNLEAYFFLSGTAKLLHYIIVIIIIVRSKNYDHHRRPEHVVAIRYPPADRLTWYTGGE